MTSKNLQATAQAPAIKRPPLRLRQACFVREYLIDQNATQAALRAGYSQKAARQIGAENLSKPAVAAAIAEGLAEIEARQKARLDEMELTAARVERETARIAFFDPRKMFTAEGAPIPLNELDADTAACIVGLDVEEVWEGKGAERVFVGHVKKYKIADKNTALDRAAKILGMYEKDNAQRVNPLVDLLSGLGRSAFPVVS